ncbi:hypothetical protein D3C71_465750 [compost metagenome]
MHGGSGNRLQQIIAAALAAVDDTQRLKLADDFTDGGSAHAQRRHQFPLRRQPVSRLQPCPLHIVGKSGLDLAHAVARRNRLHEFPAGSVQDAPSKLV